MSTVTFYNFFKRIMDALFGQKMISSCNDILDECLLIITKAFTNRNGISGFETVYNYLKWPAFWVVIILFTFELLSQAVDGRITGELTVRICIQTLIACFAIMNGISIVTFVINISIILTKTVQTAVQVVSESAAPDYDYSVYCMACYLSSIHEASQIGIIFQILFPYLISLLGSVIVRLTMLMQTIELIAMSLFAPLALADWYGPNLFQISAFRYLKNLLATAIQGAVIVGLCFAFSMVAPAVTKADPNISKVMNTAQNGEELTSDDVKNAEEVFKAAVLADTLNEGKISKVNKNGNATVNNSSTSKADSTSSDDDDDSTKNAGKNIDQVMSSKDITKVLAKKGKEFCQTIFTNANVVSICALQMMLALSIIHSKDIAKLIVG